MDKKTLDKFFDELFKLYEKYNVSIAHEDGQGGFIIDEDDKYNRQWIFEATIMNNGKPTCYEDLE